MSTAPGRLPAHGPSLRRQLLQPLFWVWALGMAIAVAGALLLARAAANAAFDRGLQDEASALASKVIWTDRGPLLDLTRQAMELVTWDRADRNAFAMIDVDGYVLAGEGRIPIPVALLGHSVQQPTVFDDVYAGEPVRGAVFTVMSPMLDRRVSIIVVESTRKRADAMRDIQIGIVLPSVALGAITFALLAWGIRRGLQPLRDVASEVAARATQDWRPLPLQQVPAEAVPLIERINTLLDNVQRSMSVQRRFIADAAHQLRTPVAGMRVLLQDLQQELAAVTPADANRPWQPVLAQLLSSSDRMARLIGQLLSLARSETSLAVDAEHHTQDIVPVLREATEPLVLRALKAGRSITLEAPDAPVAARIHPLWFGEVLVNLLDNALRYGGEHISLRVQPADAQLPARVEVEDDGPGVAPEQLGRLFEPFWRGERADVRNDGGTGLGLAIAREIVERMGGTLEAATRPQVPGMRFTIRLAA
ncbi:sensor histidine kinase [Aquabacterium sp.]|uniref:sensor histidine kinase n=1 Tax=Aquabacterium sp. TaxID=1872578 RepID=UPI002CBDE901|nr:sensor histidine kinase [Aquabacterium sp.]HSW04527.1 sensor histidine kinase [Aquabacterium sp.]